MPSPTYETQAERDAAAVEFAAELARIAAAADVPLPAPGRQYWFGTDFEGQSVRPAARGGSGGPTPDQARIRWKQDDSAPFLALSRGAVPLALGSTPDLAEAVRAASAWLAGADLAGVRHTAPFLDVQDWALAHERTPLDPVELEWRIRLQNFDHAWHPEPARVRQLWRAAFAEPRLRPLRPVSSHYTLWFSRTLHFPYESAGVAVEPRTDGTYQVRGHRRHRAVAEALPEPVTVATAAEAAALAAALAAAVLPPELH
ncbi:DUF6193 family natural product biosynthesis protein [Kitasatospora phosalacinea]|uniref:Uncharacterized protein n=1 Tax=Kitasatospora phosalacinea TaxID=2065 RepID=A0A9W6UQG4_9ACTN|nr:DUF6193 family natural product biosynthesis protein [Kitasatospora phosalacinea]GLW56127.1 hypothetical protein Kpho01_41380 [Kitasatospora phosalacinea]